MIVMRVRNGPEILRLLLRQRPVGQCQNQSSRTSVVRIALRTIRQVVAFASGPMVMLG